MKVPTMNLVWGFEVARAAKARTKKELFLAFSLAMIITAMSSLGKDWLVFLILTTVSFAVATAYVVLRRSQLRTELLAQQSYALQAISFLDFKYPLQFGRWAILPDLAEVLVSFMVERPKVILELGCGVSTLVLAYARKALNLDCQIIAIESEAWAADDVNNLLRQHGVSDGVRIIIAPLVDIPTQHGVLRWFNTNHVWDSLPEIDLLLVDAPAGKLQKLSRYPALPVLKEKFSSHIVIVLDDGRRAEERKIAVDWSAEYPDLTAFFLETLKGAWVWRKRGG